MTKKSFLIILLSFVVCVGIAAAQYPEQQQQQQQQPPGTTQQMQQLSGVVEKVDHKAKTFTLRDEVTNETKEYSFSDTTSFLKEGRTASHMDLKKGDRVSLELDPQNVPTSIRIESKSEQEKQ